MAKWGEGDPRWFVEDRKDGTNVHGWHWETKDKMSWSRGRLDQLMQDLEVIVGKESKAHITGLRDLTGEAYVTSRKGNKKAAIYDLELTLTWAGRWVEDTADADEVTGLIKIGEFALASSREEWTFEITAETDTEAARKLKASLSGLKEQLFGRLEQYVEDLQES